MSAQLMCDVSAYYYLHVLKISDSESGQVDTVHIDELSPSDEVVAETCL